MKTTMAGNHPVRWEGILLPISFLILLNFLAHFLPFERVSMALDDLEFLMPHGGLLPSQSRWEYVLSFLADRRANLSRPVMVVWPLMDWLVGNNKILWVMVPFVASSLLTVSIYFLFTELLGHRGLSLVYSAFFVLLPNKEQLYHHMLYWNMSAVYTVIAVSFTLFLTYLRTSNRRCLWVSLMCYAVLPFWYELGFFLPVLLVFAALLYNKKKRVASLLFFLPMGFNLIWRSGFLSNGQPSPLLPPGQSLWTYCWHHVSATIPSLYFGRKMIKWMLYGAARFPFIEFPWILFLLVGDGLVLWGFFRWLRKNPLPSVPVKSLLLSVAIFISFLLPSLLRPYIESRHTAMASVGFLSLLMAAIYFLMRWRPWFLTLLFGVGLIVSQGIAWNQVVSCRMNNAIAETLEEKMESILQADRVLFDQYSFAQRIPYTWVKDPLNQLDQFWGIDGLLGEGFITQLGWVMARTTPRQVMSSPQRKFLRDGIYLGRSAVQTEGEMLTFGWFTSGRIQPAKVPRRGTVVIDYEAVYPNGFFHGKRTKT